MIQGIITSTLAILLLLWLFKSIFIWLFITTTIGYWAIGIIVAIIVLFNLDEAGNELSHFKNDLVTEPSTILLSLIFIGGFIAVISGVIYILLKDEFWDAVWTIFKWLGIAILIAGALAGLTTLVPTKGVPTKKE